MGFNRLLIFSPFLLGICGLSFGQEIRDATLTQVKLVDRPKRIVTLAPSLGELVADLLGNDLSRLVGVSEYSDYPPALKKVASIGPYVQFSLEKILSLHPDLVIATTDGNPKDSVLHLRELGIPVVTVGTENFSEIQDSIRLVAKALGSPENGIQMAAQLKRGVERFRVAPHSNVRVLLQVGEDPLIVAGKNTFLHEALEILGATNLYSDSAAHYPRPSLEDIMQRNPDVIVVIALGEDLKPYQKMVAHWEEFKKLKAVKNNRVYLLKSDALLRPTLRILEGLSLLEKVIHAKK